MHVFNEDVEKNPTREEKETQVSDEEIEKIMDDLLQRLSIQGEIGKAD